MTLQWRMEWSWAGESGTVYGIDPQWVQRASLYSSDAGFRSVTVRFLPGVSVASLVQAGHQPMSGTSTIYAGDEEVAFGTWQDVEYGADDEPVTVRIIASEDADYARLPVAGDIYRTDRREAARRLARAVKSFTGNPLALLSQRKSVSYRRFVDSTLRAQGAAYPMVWGAPGDADTPGSPGLLVDTTSNPRRLMIAGHRVSATTVTIWGPTYATASGTAASDALTSQSGRTVLHDEDAAGSVYAYVEFDSAFTVDTGQVAPYPDRQFFVSWTGGDALPGGAGDVLIALYGASTLDVDMQAWSAARSLLNRWRLDGYISQFVTPSELARSAIMPALPIQTAVGPRGIRPVVWPWLDASLSAPVRRLEAGPGFVRAGGVRYAGEPLASCVVRYAYTGDTVEATREAELPAEMTPYGRAMLSSVGAAGKSEEIEASWVWDDATALDLAASRLRVLGLPRREVRYLCDPDTYGPGGVLELSVGAEVTITDADLALSSAVAVISEFEQTPTEMSVVLHLRDDPLRG